MSKMYVVTQTKNNDVITLNVLFINGSYCEEFQNKMHLS